MTQLTPKPIKRKNSKSSEKKFYQISSIKPEDNQSWEGRFFLTFDTDWADDEVMLDTYNILKAYGVESTWFITNQCNFLSTLKKDPRVEIGLHPNFNRLLNGEVLDKNSDEVISNLKKISIESVSVRSHSLVMSEKLIDIFQNNGLTHMCNLYVPLSVGELRPFRLWQETIIVPHQFQDNVHLKTGEHIHMAVNCNKFIAFNFHPIHIYLNTESLDRYEKTRDIHRNPKELIKYRYNGYGMRSLLIDLLESQRHDDSYWMQIERF